MGLRGDNLCQVTILPLCFYRKMKHSKDTSGFSINSLLVGGHLPSLLLPSLFLEFSDKSDLTRPGDFPVLLTDGLRPRFCFDPALSFRMTGALTSGESFHMTQVDPFVSPGYDPNPIRKRLLKSPRRRFRHSSTFS